MMQALSILTTISTSLSISGCIIIFAAHIFWKDLRSNSRNILVYITIADLFTAAGYLSFRGHWKHSCVVQSFITTTSSMMSFFWTSCMALYLYAVSIKANYDLGKRIIFVFHCISWPVPLLISLLALLAHKLGQACNSTGTADWCWIEEKCESANETLTASQHYEIVAWMLLTGKFWEIISYIVIIIVYARIFLYVRKQRKLVEGESSSAVVSRFRAVETRAIVIPLFFIFIRIWGTLRFFIFSFSGKNRFEHSNVLQYLQACGDGAQGFVNAILFCLIADKLRLFFKRCCSRNSGERESLLAENKSVQKDENQPSNPI